MRVPPLPLPWSLYDDVAEDAPIDFSTWTDRQLEIGARYAKQSAHGVDLLREIARRQEKDGESS